MDNVLSLIPWQGLGWGGLIFFAVLLIMRGDIVSRKVHEEVKADRDLWRSTALSLITQNSKLLAVGDLTVASFKAIEKKSQSADSDSEKGEGG